MIEQPTAPPLKQDIIEQLDMMIANIESLPDFAKNMPVTHYDLVAALWLLVQLFKENHGEPGV